MRAPFQRLRRIVILSVLVAGAAGCSATATSPSGRLAEGEGRVTLSCQVERDGKLTDCRVLDETPVGAGFAEAALEGAARARLSPRTVNGSAIGARVRFTTRFRPVEDEPATAN